MTSFFSYFPILKNRCSIIMIIIMIIKFLSPILHSKHCKLTVKWRAPSFFYTRAKVLINESSFTFTHKHLMKSAFSIYWRIAFAYRPRMIAEIARKVVFLPSARFWSMDEEIFSVKFYIRPVKKENYFILFGAKLLFFFCFTFILLFCVGILRSF